MCHFSIEPLLRKQRVKEILPYFPYGGVLVDIGCDDPPLTIQMVKDQMDFCVGIDAEVSNKTTGNYELRNCFIKKKLPVESELANVITMLAVLEHLDYPKAILQECYRILKPGGTMLLTVPSPMNKPLLEALAVLRIIRPEMIAQHKNYFTKTDLFELFNEVGFKSVEVKNFQLGLNTFVKAVK